MNRLTKAQRVEIVKNFYGNNSSTRQTFRALREIYGRHNRPTESAIKRLIQKFETTGSVCNVIPKERRKKRRSTEIIAGVQKSVSNCPEQSLRRRSQELVISYGSLWNILHEDLKVMPYKIQLVQELRSNDHSLRRKFADWALMKLKDDPLFYQKIIFSDEAHFWMNGFVNKQNSRYWSNENPHVTMKKGLYPKKLTVWCAFWSGGIIGPYFFEKGNDMAVTVTGERYRDMITNYFWHHLDNFNLNAMWFQQDGATCHTACQTIDLLREKFDGRVISRNGYVNWPPRSCDITPLDFFLWGYVKSLVYANKPSTLNDLKNNIIQVISNIGADLCEKVAKNWSTRMRYLQKSRGAHLEEVVFK